MTPGMIFVFIVVFLLIVAGVVLIILSILQPSYKINDKKTTTQQITPDLNLAFPPCYEISPDAKYVFALLKSVNMDTQYSKLLDAYSLALCQQKDKCNSNGLDSRIATLDSWEANMYNKDAVAIVNSLTKINTNKMAQFLVQICDICEKQILNIQNDPNIYRTIKTQLVGYNSQFYRNHFDTINRACDNI